MINVIDKINCQKVFNINIRISFVIKPKGKFRRTWLSIFFYDTGMRFLAVQFSLRIAWINIWYKGWYLSNYLVSCRWFHLISIQVVVFSFHPCTQIVLTEKLYFSRITLHQFIYIFGKLLEIMYLLIINEWSLVFSSVFRVGQVRKK